MAKVPLMTCIWVKKRCRHWKRVKCSSRCALSTFIHAGHGSNILFRRQVRAFGLNRMDIMQREGKYPLPPQASKTIMGVEFSGEIVSMPEQGLKSFNGEEWKEGDEVFGLAYGVRPALLSPYRTTKTGLHRIGCLCRIHCHFLQNDHPQARIPLVDRSGGHPRELDDGVSGAVPRGWVQEGRECVGACGQSILCWAAWDPG